MWFPGTILSSSSCRVIDVLRNISASWWMTAAGVLGYLSLNKPIVTWNYPLYSSTSSGSLERTILYKSCLPWPLKSPFGKPFLQLIGSPSKLSNSTMTPLNVCSSFSSMGSFLEILVISQSDAYLSVLPRKTPNYAQIHLWWTHLSRLVSEIPRKFI